MKILVGCFNKRPIIKLKNNYVLFGLGDNKLKLKPNDKTLKNIGKKNSTFCELTALYWLVNNVDDNVIGLTHYRRFFYSGIFCKKENILSANEINKLLKKYDLIVPKRGYVFPKTVYEHYVISHKEEDLKIIREIINEKYNDYLSSFDYVMNKKSYFAYNMFIGKNKIIKDYSKWLFDILFEAEKRIDLNDRNSYDKRALGFLSERLFNVWIIKNKINYIEKPVFNIENKLFIQKMQYLIKKLIFLRS